MRETRIFAAPVEVRDATEATATISGYAAVFENEYDIDGQFTESVDPKAFNRSLKNNAKDLAVVWSHDLDRVLGTVASETARFSVDEHGLRYEADLDLLDPDGIGAYRKIATGKVRKSSFSFQVVKDAWEEREEALPHRVLREVHLYEASPVLLPANQATDVDVGRAARSLAEALAIDADVTSIPEVIDLVHQRESTPAPEPDPDELHSEATQDPEPTRVRPLIDPSFQR